jgi:3-deoxy-D-manno-octulosonic-acid transferase
MAHWLQSQGIDFQYLSRLEQRLEDRHASVILVDRIGVLFELYSLGDLIFCGGTLEPIGGHNILEPAAWNKPVFYGPHLQKVKYEHTILQAFGGSFLVQDADDLLHQWGTWVHRLSQLHTYGRKAGQALDELGGTSRKQIGLILQTLSERNNRTRQHG